MPSTPWPVIYVRGYAATMNEIDDATADPFMGFNLGSTTIRQDHEGDIVRFIFESPLLRLMKDEGYVDCYKNGDFIPDDTCVPSKSIWIFRYYETASSTLGSAKRQTIPQIAQDLRRFILDVRKRVCLDNSVDPKDFRVYLVAHSMGGLVCRCYLQNICRNGTGSAKLDKELGLTAVQRTPYDAAVHLVDKVFTYATPHNGIDLLGANVPNLGPLDGFHVTNFNRKVMHEYLALPGQYRDGKDVSSLDNAFDPQRFFCLVGTNYSDYQAFFGLSKKGTGPMSDGLVMVSNAVVDDAPRAFVHRSHSGHFGIVNSEEGYQNLRRFLFGDIQVTVKLEADEILLPQAVQEKKDGGQEIRASYHIDTTARVRGATCYLHERKFSQASAVLAKYDDVVKDRNPIYLFSGYLMKRARTQDAPGTSLAFAIGVAIRVPMYEVDRKFWLDEHFEGGMLLNELITLHVEYTDAGAKVNYGLASQDGVGNAPRPASVVAGDMGDTVEIPLGFAEGQENPPRPGFRGRLLITSASWN